MRLELFPLAGRILLSLRGPRDIWAVAANRSTLLWGEGNRVELTIEDIHEVLILQREFP